jgi:hypothetical protein
MNESRICETCGAKIVMYKHSLSRGIVSGLIQLLDKSPNKPINIKRLHLSRNQWDNFQKLRYWDLVKQVMVDGKRKKGVWQITERGKAFLFGEISVSKSVWTYHGEFKKYDGKDIKIYDIKDVAYKQREDYAEGAIPLGQNTLDDWGKNENDERRTNP